MTSMNVVFIFIALTFSCCSADNNILRLRRGVVDPLPPDNATIVNTTHITQDEFVSLECSAEKVVIGVNSSYIKTLHVDKISYLQLVDNNRNPIAENECSVNTTRNNETYYLWLTSNFGACSSSIELGNGYIYVNYTLCVIPDFHSLRITRDSSVYIYFSCCYRKDLIKSLNTKIKPLARRISLEVPGVTGQLTVQMSRYTNESCSVMSETHKAYDSDKVYIGISLDFNSSRDLVLQGIECWATPTPQANNIVKYYILLNGCPAADPYIPNANELYENCKGSRIAFSFTSFHWSSLPIKNQTIFVHCNVKVCDNGDAANECVKNISSLCGSPVGKRKRRSAFDLSSSSTKTFSIGPISVEKSNVVCDKNVLGCDYDCAVTMDGKSTCICPPNMFLADDQKTCRTAKSREESNVIFLGHHLSFRELVDDPIIFILTIFILLALIGVVILFVKQA